VHLAWQVRSVRIDAADTCLRLYRSNRDFGWILFAGLVADAWLTAI
jgi:4-hydroxybenzoate polyprenyltransferase